jgi:hypothetical protein
MTVQKKSNSPKEIINTASIPLVIAEYNALREEILKIEDAQHQIISLAFIAPGTILAIGFQTRNASIMLVYPILALFLSAVWLSNSHGMSKIGAYIKSRIESKVGVDNIGWEHFNAGTIEPFRLIGFLGFRAIFIVTELITILAGISLTKFSMIENVLLIAAFMSFVLSIIMLVIFDLKRVHQGSLPQF